MPVPKLPKGAHGSVSRTSLGAFDLYTVLASRLDRQAALDAADTWAGDRIVTYTVQGRVCVRATIGATTTDGARTAVGALSRWAATMPDAKITSDARPAPIDADVVRHRRDQRAGPSKLEGALRLLGGRNSLLATLLDQGAPLNLGECVSRRLVKAPIFAEHLDRDAGFTPAEQEQARGATQRARRRSVVARRERRGAAVSAAGATDEREQVAAVAHRVGDLLVDDDLQARFAQQLEVRRGVEVAPVHRRAQPALRIVVFGEVGGAEAQQRPSAGPEDAAHLGEDRRRGRERGTWMIA